MKETLIITTCILAIVVCLNSSSLATDATSLGGGSIGGGYTGKSSTGEYGGQFKLSVVYGRCPFYCLDESQLFASYASYYYYLTRSECNNCWSCTSANPYTSACTCPDGYSLHVLDKAYIESAYTDPYLTAVIATCYK